MVDNRFILFPDKYYKLIDEKQKQVNKLLGYNVAFYNTLERAVYRQEFKNHVRETVLDVFRNARYSTGHTANVVSQRMRVVKGKSSNDKTTWEVKPLLPNYIYILYYGVPQWTATEESPFLQFKSEYVFPNSVNYIGRLKSRSPYRYDYITDIRNMAIDSSFLKRLLYEEIASDLEIKGHGDVLEWKGNSLVIHV